MYYNIVQPPPVLNIHIVCRADSATYDYDEQHAVTNKRNGKTTRCTPLA